MHTGMSVDGWGPRNLRSMPMHARVGLANVLNLVLQRLVWPFQLIIVMLTFLDKPEGGERPIALFTFAKGMRFTNSSGKGEIGILKYRRAFHLGLH